MAQTIATSSEIVSLPSGGGQLSGIGETFQPDLYTGTGNYSIPIACPSGINGLKPELYLSYTTGGGNGAFGLGFQLGVISISRETQNGIPNYQKFSKNDHFQFSGTQKLIDCGNNRYRPNFDQKFWLFERNGEHWEVTTKDGSIHYLGTTKNSRVSNDERRRVRTFSWLLDRMVDPNGNEITYTYFEDGAQRYLESIIYGPFEITVDYTDTRPDPFISRRSGFAIETRFRAQRIRILSHRNGKKELRRYELEYDEPYPRKLSLLKRVTLAAGNGSNYVAMPTVTFEYSKLSFEKQDTKIFSSKGGIKPPDLSNPNLSLVDLTGDGLPDLVISDEFSLSYWRNLGDGQWDRPKPLAELSNPIQLQDKNVQFADLEGNGTADLLIGDIDGYFPNAAGADWENPVYYDFTLPFKLNDPNLRLVDVDGDGRVDAIYSDSDSFIIFFNKGLEGWEKEGKVVRKIPGIFFSDDRIRFADMTGDGLIDIVMIESNEISYWPNLGLGNWGEEIKLDGSPTLPRNYVKRNLYLVDIDADGTADLVYIDEKKNTLQIWLNHEGRYFDQFSLIDDLPPLQGSKVLLVDMLSHGRPGVLISNSRSNSSYRYIELGSDAAPFLMTQIDNGLGGKTTVSYKPVEVYRLNARRKNKDWKSFLPFPMNVINSIEVEDHWTKKKSVTKFSYKNGHYDGELREFRGFEEVEELEEGDKWSPTVKRLYAFNVGADLLKNEAQRRSTSKRTKDRLRSLSGKELKRSIFLVQDSENTSQEKERIENIWNVVVSESHDGRIIYFPHLKESKTIEFSTDDNNKVNINRNISYDKDGNLLARETIGGRETDNNFYQELFLKENFLYAETSINLSGWKIQAICEHKVSDQENNILSLTRTYFDGDIFVGLPLGEIKLGNVSRIEELVFDEDITIYFNEIDPSSVGYHLSEVNGKRKWFRNKVGYKYASDGTVQAVKGPRNEILKLEYDSFGIHPISSINALGHKTELSIDENVEAINEIKYPSGYKEYRKYDALGRVILLVRLEDDGGKQIYRAIRYLTGKISGYNASPPSIITIIPRKRLESETDIPDNNTPLDNQPNFIIQRVFYNGFGRELQRKVSAEPDENGNRRVSVSANRSFDKRGFLYAQGDPYFSDSFAYQNSSYSNSTNYSFEFKRDYLGRVISASRKGVGTRLTEYSPWEIKSWDEVDSDLKIKPTRVEYIDSWNRQIELKEYENSVDFRKTIYRYDLRNNLLNVIDNLERSTLKIDYDYLGRRISITHSDSGTRSYFLNAGDKVVESFSSVGVNLVNTYDEINRIVEITKRSDSGTLTHLRRFWYDQNIDNSQQLNTIGRLTKVEDEAGFIEYEYNLAGQITSKSRRLLDGRVFTLKTEYDSLLNISSLTYPNGSIVNYIYNESNLVQSIPNIVKSITYNIKGKPEKILFSNGVFEQYSYDQVSRLLRYKVVRSNNQEIFSQKFWYNQGLDVVKLEESCSESNTLISFEYDGLKQLTKITESERNTFFEYDSVGNILRNSQLGDGFFEYNDPEKPNTITNQPSLNGPINTKYDRAGRLTTGRKFSEVKYDSYGRILSMQLYNDSKIEYVFGYGLGRVVKRVYSPLKPVVETFYFDEIYEETDTKSKAHIMISGSHSASIISHDQQTKLEIYHNDRLGNTRCITTDDGEITYYQENTAFGVSLNSGLPIKHFIGRDYDEDSKLIWLGTRFYDPEIGRFITPDEDIISDPLNFISSPIHYNPFAYSANNPVSYRDPNGRFAIIAGVAAVAKISAVVVGVAVGAYLGYRAAKEQGHSPWTGALIGGVIGGLTGGLGGFAALKVAAKASVLGAGLSVITGDKENIWTSAAISFAFGAIGHGIGDWTPVSGQGFWVNTQNIGKEIAYGALNGALYGAVFNATTEDDIQDGFEDGAVKGALFATGKVVLGGIRYDAINGKEKQIEFEYNKQAIKDTSKYASNLKKEGYPGSKGLIFRRYGLINPLVEFFNGGPTSLVLADNVVMAEGTHYKIETIALSIRQAQTHNLFTFGTFEYFARYLFD